MERETIKDRNMIDFVLSSFLNFGIGLGFGFVVGIIATIATSGTIAVFTMLIIPLFIAVSVAAVSANMYRTYFYYRLSMDIDAICEGDGQESESYLLAIVLSMLTLNLYHLYWSYKLAQRLRVNCPRYGFKMFETGKDIVLLHAFSFGFISAYELIKNVNRAARVFNVSGSPNVDMPETDMITMDGGAY